MIVMKKQYEKPMLAVEYYQLSQSIAACVTRINFATSDCVKNDEDSTDKMKEFAWAGYFISKPGCEQEATGMDQDDSICYHTSTNAAFTS